MSSSTARQLLAPPRFASSYSRYASLAMQQDTQATVADPTPWHASYPQPQSTPGSISARDLLELQKTATAGKDYLLVDLRRNDHEVR